MTVATPVIGIPKWSWKPALINLATQRPNVHKLIIDDFCYECSRHFQLLKMFDENGDVSQTLYYRYQKEARRSNRSIMDKIHHFAKLYSSVRKRGCKTHPIVTIDGCRLNGSHRLSILIHLGVHEAFINVVDYESLVSSRKCRRISKQVNRYRAKVYNL